MTQEAPAFHILILRYILRSFSFLYPFYSGGGILSKLPIFKLAAPKQPCLANLKNGRKIWLDPSEYFCRTVYYFRDFDPKVTFFCRKILEKDDLFLDIGANIGTIFLNCLDILDSEAGGQVHAFEPNPRLIKYLEKTLSNNSDIETDNIFIHPVGLSDKDGTATLNVPSDNIGSASINRCIKGEEVTIQIKDSLTVFEEIISNNDNSYVIKIDVEGHELIIFNRIKKFIALQKPKAVIFEFTEECNDSEQPEIFVLFRQIGMRIYSISRRSLVKPSLHLLPENFEISSSTDYIAIDETKLDWFKSQV